MKASDGSPSQEEVPDLEKENDEELNSSSKEKSIHDVADDKEVGIGSPKKRPRATKLQKLQIEIEELQMLRKLRTKHYVEKYSEKIDKVFVKIMRVGKEKVVEEKQLPPRAKTFDVKALKEKDGKWDDGGIRPLKKGAAKCPKIQSVYSTPLI